MSGVIRGLLLRGQGLGFLKTNGFSSSLAEKCFFPTVPVGGVATHPHLDFQRTPYTSVNIPLLVYWYRRTHFFLQLFCTSLKWLDGLT
jgi:hypothetical protein